MWAVYPFLTTTQSAAVSCDAVYWNNRLHQLALTCFSTVTFYVTWLRASSQDRGRVASSDIRHVTACLVILKVLR